jgi:hypothetical protein
MKKQQRIVELERLLERARSDRSAYIEALRRALAPQLQELPTDPVLVPRGDGHFLLQLFRTDGQIAYSYFVPKDGGMVVDLFIPEEVTGFMVSAPPPPVVESGAELDEGSGDV